MTEVEGVTQLHLQEWTRGDVTRTASQDRPSTGFAASYSPAPLKTHRPEGVFALPEKENFHFAFQCKAFSLLSPPPDRFLCKPSDFHFLFEAATFAFHWALSPASSFPACEGGLCRDVLGCTSESLGAGPQAQQQWQLFSQPVAPCARTATLFHAGSLGGCLDGGRWSLSGIRPVTAACVR